MQGEEKVTKKKCRLPFQSPENPAINRITTKKEKKTQKTPKQNKNPPKKPPQTGGMLLCPLRILLLCILQGNQCASLFPVSSHILDFKDIFKNGAWERRLNLKSASLCNPGGKSRDDLIMEPAKSLAAEMPDTACMWNSDLYI